MTDVRTAGTLPTTMRASVLYGVGELGVEERPVPVPAPDEVLVEVGSVGVCGSDVHYYQHGRIGDFVVRAPLVLGHEAGGRVVGLGAGVPQQRLGQRVSLEPGIPCRRCDQCRHGRYNLCPDVRFFATPPVDGAFCQYVAVPADFAYPVPEAVSDDAAGLLEPLSVGIWSCRKAGVGPGSRVLIAGAGPIGLVTAQVAAAFGAIEVIATDVAAPRLDAARRLGATGTVPAGTVLADGDAVDAFIDCSGAAPAVDAGIRSVRPAGSVVLVGMGADAIPVPVPVIQGRELRLTGTFRYANTWPLAIALAAAGRVDLDALVTGHFGLDDVSAALAASADPTAIKAIVTPQR
ncbi:NAD(P)-dependent alcohol dehydrogenase [Actinocatenispora sera]|uniref:Sorbitol dehydrogenase n=1 Tax=Actinocatenispora sera TaxID=390989 RepID=A0A810L3S4_9ACTN|nr:NAD(P)-dependent alcohol dehydrogenase [Actinocatenispora sera]BCJ29555.1 sorbitol dehydrogenase [Actinocatenispora sera]